MDIIMTAITSAVAQLSNTLISDSYNLFKSKLLSKSNKKDALRNALSIYENNPSSEEARNQIEIYIRNIKIDQFDELVHAARKILAAHGELSKSIVNQSIDGNHNIVTGTGNVSINMNSD